MARLHSAGAIVRHASPFANLPTYKNETELSDHFIQKWVHPFYMKIGKKSNELWIQKIKEVNNEITSEMTLTLLGDFNWRPRLVGAYFSAVKGFIDQIDIIGTHLLKSEVSCVGHIYAIVLAFYNNEKSNKYLNDYLDYYLQKPDLYFDQEIALETLVYLDEINGTNNFEKYLIAWEKFQKDRELLSKQNSLRIAKLINEQEGKEFAENYLKTINEIEKPEIKKGFETEGIKYQIEILTELAKYCS